MSMSGKERILKTLRFEEPDRPPHFELTFELTEEAFGLDFPRQEEWEKCSTGAERQRLWGRCGEMYQRIAEAWAWDALAVWRPWADPEAVRAARKALGPDFFLGALIGRTVWAIDTIQDWDAFALDLAEHPGRIHEEARRRVEGFAEHASRLIEAGADFIVMVNDVAFNGGPFVSPAQFAQIVTPYWAQAVEHVRKSGAIPFIHSDGNLMPILDQLLSLGAACLHSLDPLAGMDLSLMKARCQGRLALMGNVGCAFLQRGPPEAIRDSARYALKYGPPGGGYIFSSSNTIFPGVPLSHYQVMLDEYRSAFGGKGDPPSRSHP